MKFETRKDGGRTVILEHSEAFCRECGLRYGESRTSWFYYPTKPSDGLYCRSCSSDPRIHVNIVNEDSIFWLVDNFEFVTIVRGEKSE